MLIKIKAFCLSILIICWAGYDSCDAQFYSLQTKNLNLVYYTYSHQYLTPHIARCFENAYNYHANLFDYTSNEKVTVLMQDFWDYGNAGASSVPFNRIILGLAPLNYTFETSPANERFNHTLNHEMVHIVAMDKASDNDNFYRKIFFGKVPISSEDPLSMLYAYLTIPRRFSPRWYHEGIAVFMETWMAGGIGRALGNYDEMVFRTMVRDSSYFYSVIGLESEGTAIDFQIGVNSYLYGTRFMSYLVVRYGPDKLIKWVSNTDNRKKYFASDFKQNYNTSLDEEWRRWIAWEHDFQKSNLDSIRQFSTTKFRNISKNALGSISQAFYDENAHTLYVATLYPAQTAQIAAINIKNGTIRKICEITGPGLYYVTSLTHDASAGILYYTTDNGNWRDLNSVDIQTGKSKLLIKDFRTGDLTLNQVDKSIWGIRHYNGITSIVRIPPPYKQANLIFSWPYGNDLYNIDISPDAEYLVGALATISGEQLLIKMRIDSLMSGIIISDTLYNFDTSLPANFTYSEDGRFLYGSSYYSGVSNIFRYDLREDDIVALSNCETGFFRPVPLAGDSLIVFRYTGQGFLPVMIADKPVEDVSAIRFLGNEIVNKYPDIKNWVADSPSKVNLDSLLTYSGEYRSISDIKLSSAYPVIDGYKNTVAIGARLNFSDPLGMATVDGKLSYSPTANLPKNERLHAKLGFKYWNWEAKFSYNQADFYDLFGPTKTSRKGYALGLKYQHSIIYEKPRFLDLTINLNGYANLDRLPFFQNVESPVEKFLTLGASLKYQYLLKTLGAVEEEKGIKAELSTYNYYADSEFFPHLLLNLAYGFLLPIDHSSLWIRSSFGISGGDRDIAFSNYYFGGFGNNWIDHQSVQRYREYYSFPGVSLNSIDAQNYIKLMLEWTLPPIRFRRFGFTNLYLNWMRLALFTSGIAEDIFNKEYQGKVVNLGTQIDFKLVIFTQMSSTFSIGYAAAFRERQRLSNEFMISLKIM